MSIKISPGTVRLPIIALAAIMGFTLLLSKATPATNDRAINMSSYEELLTKAKTQGTVRVIATLRMPFQAEDTLPDPEAIRKQRETIAALQDAVLKRLSSYNVASVRRYQYTPALAMEVDAPALMELNDLPEVAGIMEDIAVPPLGPAHQPKGE